MHYVKRIGSPKVVPKEVLFYFVVESYRNQQKGCPFIIEYKIRTGPQVCDNGCLHTLAIRLNNTALSQLHLLFNNGYWQIGILSASQSLQV